MTLRYYTLIFIIVMKWNDLTLKERKRIYDSVRSKNPKITYLELKEQFDNIPSYKDGKDNYSKSGVNGKIIT